MFCKLAVLHHPLSFFRPFRLARRACWRWLDSSAAAGTSCRPHTITSCHFQMKPMEMAVFPSEVTHGTMDFVKEQLNFCWCVSYTIRPQGSCISHLSVVSAEQWEVLFFTHGKQSMKVQGRNNQMLFWPSLPPIWLWIHARLEVSWALPLPCMPVVQLFISAPWIHDGI